MNAAQQNELAAQSARLAQERAASEAAMRNAAAQQAIADVQSRLAADAAQRKAAEDQKAAEQKNAVDDIKARAATELRERLTGKYEHLLLDSKQLVLGKALGSGAFATVYEGTCGALGRVAIKDMNRRDGSVAAGLRDTIGRVAGEVDVLQYLSAHARMDAIVRFHGFAVESATQALQLVMELAPGRPLSDILHGEEGKGGRAPVKLTDTQVFLIAERLARGVAWLHEKRCVHRDLKPHNIVVDLATLSVRIVDFGIARVLPEGRTFDDQHDAAAAALAAADHAAIAAILREDRAAAAASAAAAVPNKAGSGGAAAAAEPAKPLPAAANAVLAPVAPVCGAASPAATPVAPDAAKRKAEALQLSLGVGTLLYIAPEVFASGQYDDRCDVWAYGMILWELLTGTYGFLDPTLSGDDIQTLLQSGQTPSTFLDDVLGDPSHAHYATAKKADARRRQMSDTLWCLMEKCLNSDPVHRLSGKELPSFFTTQSNKPYAASAEAMLMARAQRESMKTSFLEVLARSEMDAALARSRTDAALNTDDVADIKRPPRASAKTGRGTAQPWSCTACTYANASLSSTKCEMCSAPRATPSILVPLAKPTAATASTASGLSPAVVCPACGKSSAAVQAAQPALKFEDHVEFCLAGALPK